MRFSSKGHFLITGASSGIGRAVALRCADEGVSLVLTGRDMDRLNETAQSVIAKGGQATCAQLDVTQEEEWGKLVRKIKEAGGSLSGLICCAGENRLGPVNAVRSRDLLALLDVNLISVVTGARFCLSLLVKGAPSSVVLVSSVAALRGSPGLGAYGAAKGALISWARTAAVELSGKGVRVNVVVPGVVKTPMGALLERSAGENAWGEIVRSHLLGLGSPEDVAGPIVFLCSDDARWITGAVLAVDGGLSAH